MKNRNESDEFSEQIKRLKKLNLLIKSKTTGTLEKLAEKLHVSESVISDDLEFMNERGAGITYDFVKKSYYYTYPGDFFIGWMSPEEKQKLDKDKELRKKANMPVRVDINRLIKISKK